MLEVQTKVKRQIEIVGLTVENSESVRIDYRKDGSTLEEDREINPLLMFGSDGYWRALAAPDGRIKQFLSVQVTVFRSWRSHLRMLAHNDIFLQPNTNT